MWNISKNIKKKKKESSLKFHKTVVIPTLTYGCETWAIKEKEWDKINAAGMRYLRAIEGCTIMDKIKTEEIRYV